MIFLSHNKQDKTIVRQIAETLQKTFGMKNVFYDEWSIQPGDSIISKMNEGLEKCEYFFFFVSKNSLISKMVEMEWQSALMKKANKNIKFIPVRLDNSNLPAIILQTLYIDLYSYGLDIAIRQMIDVINGQNTYRTTSTFSNIYSEIINNNDNTIVEIKALYYMEPHSRYLIIVDNNKDDLTWSLPEFNEYTSGFNENISFSNGKHNCILIEVPGATSPNFPVKIIFKSQNEAKINILHVMHAVSRTDFKEIPMKILSGGKK